MSISNCASDHYCGDRGWTQDNAQMKPKYREIVDDSTVRALELACLPSEHHALLPVLLLPKPLSELPSLLSR